MPKIKVGALTFTVKYTSDPITIEDKDGEQSECWGDVSHKNHLIQINTDAPEIRQKTALLHEVLHVISEEYQTNLNEPTVTCLASGLMAVISGNKWFREKLLGD